MTKKLLILTSIIISFMPWIDFGIKVSDSDIQPFFLLPLFALTVYAIANKELAITKTQLKVIAAYLLCILGIIVSEINFGVSSLTARGIFPYVTSVFLFTIWGALKRSPQNDLIIIRSINIAFYLWLAACIFQTLFQPLILDGLLSRVVYSPGRGVSGFSTEPSYAGSVFIFFVIIYSMTRNKTKTLIAACGGMILTMSSVFVLNILAIAAISLLFNTKTKTLLKLAASIPILILAISILLSSGALENSRLFYFINSASSLQFSNFTYDSSVNVRLSHFIVSIYGSIQNWMIPNGFGSWKPFLDKVVYTDGIFPFLYATDQTTRINNGLGAIIYESGFFGIILIISLLSYLRKITKSWKTAFEYSSIIIVLLTLQGLYIVFPYAYILVYLAKPTQTERTAI